MGGGTQLFGWDQTTELPGLPRADGNINPGKEIQGRSRPF